MSYEKETSAGRDPWIAEGMCVTAQRKKSPESEPLGFVLQIKISARLLLRTQRFRRLAAKLAENLEHAVEMR
jgi:hypothetical protein